MAEFMTPTPEQRAAFDKWILGRPEIVRDMVHKYGLTPWKLYRYTETGHRCSVHGFSEDGTVIINVTGQFNLIAFGRRVFGVNPALLEECELPLPGEAVGETLNREEQLEYINAMRASNGLEPLSAQELEEMSTADASGQIECALSARPKESS